MTDARRPGRSSQTQRGPQRQLSDVDRFGLRFSQLVRVCGLVIAIYQGILVNLFFHTGADPVAMGGAATMMSFSLVADKIIKRGKDS